MKYWRYYALTQLNDLADAFILSSTPRQIFAPPTLCYAGVHGEAIAWARFDELIQRRDIEQYTPGRTVIIEDGDEYTVLYYRLSDTGRTALQALPGWDAREARRKAVSV